jgi:hypothetical protein
MKFRQAAIGVAACFYIVLIMIVILIRVRDVFFRVIRVAYCRFLSGNR